MDFLVLSILIAYRVSGSFAMSEHNLMGYKELRRNSTRKSQAAGTRLLEWALQSALHITLTDPESENQTSNRRHKVIKPKPLIQVKKSEFW